MPHHQKENNPDRDALLIVGVDAYYSLPFTSGRMPWVRFPSVL